MSDEPKAFMPLYPGDYLLDTSHLTLEQHGAYLMLLMTMWRRGGVLPSDRGALARILGVSSERFEALWGAIGEFFPEKGGRITNPRLTEELERARGLRKARRERARKAAEARWDKERAERSDDAPSNAPSMPEAVLDECHSPSPSQSPSTSGSSSDRSSRARAAGPPGADPGGNGGEPDGEVVRSVLEYLNGLAGTSYAGPHASEYLRERLAEGWTREQCELVAEAALVCEDLEDLNPRRIYSEKRFPGLWSLRSDRRRWSRHEERFEELVEAMGEREGVEV